MKWKPVEGMTLEGNWCDGTISDGRICDVETLNSTDGEGFDPIYADDDGIVSVNDNGDILITVVNSVITVEQVERLLSNAMEGN